VKLSAIREAAAVYGVARNLKRRFDEGKGLPRFKPVLDIVKSLDATYFSDKKFISSIERVRNRIACAYGGSDSLSFTTKILWLRFKCPIIVYDANSLKVLGTKKSEFAPFCAAWKEAYGKVRADIETACERLPAVAKFSVFGNDLTREYITELISNDWFKERVFDSWLWHTGAKSSREEGS
jgi:hypothetical protein